MGITAEEFKRIEGLLPVQRGSARCDSPAFPNAVPCVAENGCKLTVRNRKLRLRHRKRAKLRLRRRKRAKRPAWRGLPKEHGNRDSAHMRANGRAKNGVPGRVFLAPQRGRIIAIGWSASPPTARASSSIPTPTAPKKTAPGPSGGPAAPGACGSAPPRGGTQSFMWLLRMTRLS